MDTLARAVVIGALILGGAYIVRGLYPADRFTLVAAQGGSFRLDRLTGSVLFCDAIACRVLPLAKIVPVAPPPAAPSGGNGT